jgi:NADH dehydrogenase
MTSARRSTPTRKPRPRVVVVGANFAGLTAAQRLGAGYAVTVFDRSRWFEWRPNIHELLSGVKRPADLRLPLARLVARAGHRFVRATVAAVDAGKGQVVSADGRRFDFDACIVAVGGGSETFGVPGADRHAMPFKSVDDCAAIGRRLAALARTGHPQSVVIVGGGLEGIEALGEILRAWRHRENLAITVVEAGSRLMPGCPPALDRAVRARCADSNVRFLTRSRVTGITRKRVRLDPGASLRADLTIWTAGASPSPLLRGSGLAGARQWAAVDPTLRSRRYRNVFVVGDAAALPRPRDKQAFYAIQMGECAADNVMRGLSGRRLRSFKAAPKPMLVAFGDLDTFLVAGRTVIASPTLAAAKEAVFQFTMAQFDPPLDARALRDLLGRFSSAREKLAFPAISGRASGAARRRSSG